VPCPGGSGGGGFGWASLASPALASAVGSAAVWGALACGAAMGADGVIAETLTFGFLGSSPPMVAGADQGFVNPIVKMRAIGADQARMVNGTCYWSRLREIVIEDSVLVRVQRRSRRR
jgi:hypothetical protein